MRIIGSHADSPRIDLKQNPLYGRWKFSFNGYTPIMGGSKKYQWVTLPYITWNSSKKDGTKINIVYWRR